MKTKTHFISGLALFSLFLSFFSCSNKPGNITQCPFKNVDVAFNSFETDPSKGDTIKMENGSSIVIPPDAFVDSDGNAITDKVQIKYREFHNAVDILASGISMQYDSAGTKHNFQTAGMFELNGFVNNQTPVFIAKNKTITVNMASGKNDGNYNFYSVDKKTNTWKFESTSIPTENKERKMLLKEFSCLQAEPKMPEKYVEGSLAFEFDFDMTQHPELKTFDGLTWQYAGNGSEAEPDPSKEDWVFKFNWSKAEITAHNPEALLYKMTLTGAGRSFSTIVKPVLKGNKFKQALANFKKKLEDYAAIKVRKESLEKTIEKQQEFIRSYALQGFGIYNYDRIYHNPDAIMVNAIFELDKNSPVNIEEVSVYLICADDRSLNTYTYDTWNKFGYFPNDNNRLVVVLPDNRIATFEDADFKKLNPKQFENGSSHVFHLQTQNAVIKSMDDLYVMLGK
jgi:hypothetical protein